MWQALRDELQGTDTEVVTVALDTGGVAAAKPFVDMAEPKHPSLLDEAHVLGELLGFVNVPMAVWIDETGTLVRPAHAAHIQVSAFRDAPIPEGLPERIHDTLVEVKKMRVDPEGYRSALVDWAQRGADSPYALDPDAVIAASQPRPPDHARAIASFELGQHLWRTGERDAAVHWFREAHRLHPENWTYKRQAWTFATTKEGEPSDLLQGPTDLYDGNWLDDIRRQGADTYYPPFDG
ncbi:MAG: hypothetical protein QOE35_1890 [Actinomycetota bacterium]